MFNDRKFSVQSRSVEQGSNHLIREVLSLLGVSIGNLLRAKQTLGNSDAAGTCNVYAVLFEDAGQPAAALPSLERMTRATLCALAVDRSWQNLTSLGSILP